MDWLVNVTGAGYVWLNLIGFAIILTLFRVEILPERGIKFWTTSLAIYLVIGIWLIGFWIIVLKALVVFLISEAVVLFIVNEMPNKYMSKRSVRAIKMWHAPHDYEWVIKLYALSAGIGLVILKMITGCEGNNVSKVRTSKTTHMTKYERTISEYSLYYNDDYNRVGIEGSVWTYKMKD